MNVEKIDFYDDRFEVNAIFNKKGKYKVEIFGNNVRNTTCHGMIEYIVEVQNDSKKNLSFPKFYSGKEEINIIEPLYDNLKSGEIVNFKIKSKLDIIIIDIKLNYLKRNEEGYFEFKTKINTLKGQNFIIGKKSKTGSCNYLAVYKAI